MKTDQKPGSHETPTHEAALLQVHAYRNLQSYVAAFLEDYELTPQEWALLGFLSVGHRPFRVSTVAELLRVAPPRATALVADLEMRGLLRLKPDHRDVRAKLVVLTPRAETLARDVEGKLKSLLEEYLGDIPADDLAAYMRVVASIASKREANS
jgi:DNA-binding MarR family transcriptional regulator